MNKSLSRAFLISLGIPTVFIPGLVLASILGWDWQKDLVRLAGSAGSYINKKAGENLYQTMGYWFNASDLASQIPKTMKKFLPR